MSSNPILKVIKHTRLTAPCLGIPRWASTRKVKPIWVLLKQETVSGSEIRWAICNSASRSRQITMPEPHRSVFYRPDALPAAQPTATKHWRQKVTKRHWIKKASWCDLQATCRIISPLMWTHMTENEQKEMLQYLHSSVMLTGDIKMYIWLCICVTNIKPLSNYAVP